MIIAVINNKGGVGKTTSARNIADALVLRDKSVLCVDLDSSNNLTQSFSTEQEKGIGALLAGETKLDKVLLPGSPALIPAGANLKQYEGLFTASPMSFKLLKKVLPKDYDFIVLDCPPNLGILTTMAIYACQYYIVPLEPEHFSVNGLADLLDYAEQVTEEDRFLGAFATRYHAKERSRLKRQMLDLASNKLEGRVFKTMIRRNVSIAEAQAMGESIFEYAPDSNGSEDYQNLTQEILTKLS